MTEHVVLINDDGAQKNAPAAIAIGSALALAATGLHVVFFCATAPVDGALLAHPNIRVVCTEQPALTENPSRLAAAVQGLWNLPARRLLGAVLAGLPRQTTVVHFHLWAKALSPSLFGLVARFGLPVFITTHEYYTVCPNGGLLHYPSGAICQWRPLSVRCVLCQCDRRSFLQKLWRVLRQVIQNRGIRRIKRVTFLAVSRLNQAVLGRYWPAGALVYHPNFVSVLPPLPTAICFKNNRQYLFVGRLDPEKGIALFCGALAELGLLGIAIGAASCPRDAARLKARFPNVQFTGHLAGADMLPYIARARALVFSSIWYEGMGLVPFEMQMNYHMPCIISDCTAAAPLAAGGGTGLLFAAGSKQDLKRAILQLQSDSVVAAMQKSIEAVDFSEYQLSRHVGRLCRLYNKATAQEDSHA